MNRFVPSLVAGLALVTTYLSAAASADQSVGSLGRPCAEQLANDGLGVPSQNFEKAFGAYNSQGADDFRLKSACTVGEVEVNGSFYNGAGPVRSIHVSFYADDSGTPGAVLAAQNHLGFKDPSGKGNFEIPLRTAVVLEPGTYWVSVKVNMPFVPGGEWVWNTNTTVLGHDAVWRNSRDGFGTGCTTYTDLHTCMPSSGSDLAFALLK